MSTTPPYNSGYRETGPNEYQAVAFTLQNDNDDELLQSWEKKAYPHLRFTLPDSVNPTRIWYAGYLTKNDTKTILGNYRTYYNKRSLPMKYRSLTNLNTFLTQVDTDAVAVQISLTTSPQYSNGNKIIVETQLKTIAEKLAKVFPYD